jgi:protease IV
MYFFRSYQSWKNNKTGVMLVFEEKIKIWLFFTSMILFVCSCATIQMGPRLGSLAEISIEEGNSAVKILLVDIDGPISNRSKKTLSGFKSETGMVDRVREILKKAEKDKKIKSILLRINSPGGTVTSSDIIYNEIKSFKERNKIKVYVSVVDVAASGGYYIAMASDFIMVHPTSITGSIGVLVLKLNLKGLMDKVGVEWEVVKSAEKKDFMSPFRALSNEERKLFQKTIDGYYERFVSIVASNRHQLDVNAVKVLADGRVFDSHEALQRKLVDSIGYLSDLVKHIENDLNLRDMQVVSYVRPDGYKSNFYSSINSLPKINLINLDMGFDWHQISPQFLFLWGGNN